MEKIKLWKQNLNNRNNIKEFKKSQSQRKTPSNKLSERNDIARNKYSNINTFRQTKESKCFSSNERVKKKLISYQDSSLTSCPKTRDIIKFNERVNSKILHYRNNKIMNKKIKKK